MHTQGQRRVISPHEPKSLDAHSKASTASLNPNLSGQEGSGHRSRRPQGTGLATLAT